MLASNGLCVCSFSAAAEREIAPGTISSRSRCHKGGNGAVPQSTHTTGNGARWSVMRNREHLPCYRVNQELFDKKTRFSPSQFRPQRVRRCRQSAREISAPSWGSTCCVWNFHQSTRRWKHTKLADIKSPNFFLHEAKLFASWFVCKLRSFGLLESECQYCASLLPLQWDVPHLSPRKGLRLLAPLFPLDCL